MTNARHNNRLRDTWVLTWKCIKKSETNETLSREKKMYFLFLKNSNYFKYCNDEQETEDDPEENEEKQINLEIDYELKIQN